MTGSNPWECMVSSKSLVARLTRIPGFKWPIKQVQLRIIIQEEGHNVSKLESPFTPATVMDGAAVTSSINTTTMTVFPEAHTIFTSFISELATKAEHTFGIKGSADIQFNLGPLGIHTMHGVDFVSDLTLRGLNNFPDLQCTSVTNVVRVTAYKLEASVVFTIQNPSQLEFVLGDFQFAVYSMGDENSGKSEQFMGALTFPDLKLVQGVNEDKTGILLLDMSMDTVKEFLQAGEPRKVKLSGYGKSSANEAINAGLANMVTTVTFPAFSTPAE
ncbi:hypothetical protein FBU30_010269 [Linnemannia zychae]|nr:hypothetical protein FBU30_010269 [Linnemannia zychae]